MACGWSASGNVCDYLYEFRYVHYKSVAIVELILSLPVNSRHSIHVYLLGRTESSLVRSYERLCAGAGVYHPCGWAHPCEFDVFVVDRWGTPLHERWIGVLCDSGYWFRWHLDGVVITKISVQKVKWYGELFWRIRTFYYDRLDLPVVLSWLFILVSL